MQDGRRQHDFFLRVKHRVHRLHSRLQEELQKLTGVREVKSFVMTNTIKVAIDPKIVTIDEVKKEILNVAARAGFSGRVVFSRI